MNGSKHPLLSSDVEASSRNQQILAADLQRMLCNFVVVMDNVEASLGAVDERKVRRMRGLMRRRHCKSNRKRQ